VSQVVTGLAVVDLGAFPGAGEGTFAVTGQTEIASDAVVSAWLRPAATADHTIDEHKLESLLVSAHDVVPGVGFTITVAPTQEGQYGLWSVAWTWQARS
jgi:hypothetical protein